ncbi:MAG: PDZ domain-containing protein [Gammaproteobacteria bacterium]|nr:PDZ domain-containing protein [Gammaproteobacteria bacterium]
MKKFIVILLIFGINACSSTYKPSTKTSGIDEGTTAASPAMPELRSIILDMADKDQAIDQVLQETLTGNEKPFAEPELPAELKKTILDIYQTNTEAAKKIYAKNGWPNSSMIGLDGVNAFWLLVQHSTDHEFQRTLLPSVKTAFSEGEIIDAQGFAWLVDQLLVNDGKLQKYGTQIKEWSDRTPILFDIENPGQVNAVRGSIGLFNLEGYLSAVKACYLRESTCNNPAEVQDVEDNRGGIGVSLDIKGSGSIDTMTLKSLTVIKVIEGSPAARAGLQFGDRIIEIDGLSVEGRNGNTLLNALHKPVGSQVTIVVRQTVGSERKITMVTAKLPEV